MTVDYLVGKTCVKVERKDDEEIIFTLDNGEILKLYHEQDCCECVEIEDICGDLINLIGAPIIKAEESTVEVELEEYDHQTATFYLFATLKGYVTIRWLGQSNGYYSEAVDFAMVRKEM